MDYTDYSYLWPPRPEKAIPADLLNFYENRGFWAQVKKNGTCTVVFARGKDVIFKTRHNDDHKAWSPNPEHVRFFQGSTNWNVYVAELIHSKTPHIKNQFYIFDKIVDEGIHLIGTTFEERQLLLQSQWEGTYEPAQHQTRITDYISVAENIGNNFAEVYASLNSAEDEGLVLKNPKAQLQACLKQTANANWQVKCRVATKNYGF
jgi:hypothetical protein